MNVQIDLVDIPTSLCVERFDSGNGISSSCEGFVPMVVSCRRLLLKVFFLRLVEEMMSDSIGVSRNQIAIVPMMIPVTRHANPTTGLVQSLAKKDKKNPPSQSKWSMEF